MEVRGNEDSISEVNERSENRGKVIGNEERGSGGK